MFVFCCLCVFLYFNHYITLYYSFQFNIIIHTHGSPGWLLLISFLLLFSFLSFLRGSWFSVCWFPFFLILSPLLLLSPQFCLICICGTLARALSLALYCLLLYQLLLLMFAAACFPLPSLLHQEHEIREKKTCDLRLSSLSCCISTHTIMLPSSSSSSLAVGVLQLVGQPVQALVQTVAAGCARCLNVPVAVPQRVQAQLVGDFGGVHRIW